MDYVLAKELNDAGFPQAGDGKWVLPPDRLVARRADRIYVPTLSELIKACGEGFVRLHKVEGRWIAGDGGLGVVRGATPKEAVARLWLALHTHT
jgi:hypothetical protein